MRGNSYGRKVSFVLARYAIRLESKFNIGVQRYTVVLD